MSPGWATLRDPQDRLVPPPVAALSPTSLLRRATEKRGAGPLDNTHNGETCACRAVCLGHIGAEMI
jgi:hypothetical protein